MGEGMFYGFEDVSDDYDYGTEVYKDDIYEGHPNMQIPYKEKKMMYIPSGFFEEKCHDIGGYLKLGKEMHEKFLENIKDLKGKKKKRIFKNKKLENLIDNNIYEEFEMIKDLKLNKNQTKKIIDEKYKILFEENLNILNKVRKK